MKRNNEENLDFENEQEAEKENEDQLEDALELDEKLEEKNDEINSLTTQLLRLQADFANFRKRTEKEKTNIVNYALEDFICSLLPILDNFEIAMESSEDKEDPFYKGIELIYNDLQNSLKSNGVETIDSLGEEFDPNIHHAVFMEESDEYESGKVIEILKAGYRLKDKVIRPTMVKVAK